MTQRTLRIRKLWAGKGIACTFPRSQRARIHAHESYEMTVDKLTRTRLRFEDAVTAFLCGLRNTIVLATPSITFERPQKFFVRLMIPFSLFYTSVAGSFISKMFPLYYIKISKFGTRAPTKHSVFSLSAPPRKQHSQMLVEEIQHRLVAALILLLHFLILKIRARSHPSMYLIGEPLNDMWNFNTALPLLDILFALVPGWEHGVRDCDAGCVVTSDHSWVASCGSAKGCVFHRREVHNLSAPAIPHKSPLFNSPLFP